MRISRKALLLLLFLYAAAAPLAAQVPTRANQVKAVFLYNFTQFVQWPPAAINHPAFVIGVVGSDPFGTYLTRVVEGEKVNDHPILVRRYVNLSEAKDCQMVFINSSYSAEGLKELNSRNILTVSDKEDFIKAGGMIRFFIENNKIRLQVNMKAVQAAGLLISSKLLRIADIVE